MWRMLSGNGRETARGMHARGSVVECYDDLYLMQRAMETAVMEQVLQNGGQRSWVARINDIPVARSSMSYQRDWDLIKAFDLFCAFAPDADVDPVVLNISKR